MTITTLPSQDFDQNVEQAKESAALGPVFVTDRGRPTHVLLSIEEYQRLTGEQVSMIDMLGLPAGVEDIEFDVP